MAEKKKRWRPSLTAYRELEAKVNELSEKERKCYEDYIMLEKRYQEKEKQVKSLQSKVATLEASNMHMEDGIIAEREQRKEAEKQLDKARNEYKALKDRTFWKRVFNK